MAVVTAEGIGKLYRLGSFVGGYGRLSESLASALRAPYRRLRGVSGRPEREYLWALRDVSFEVDHGEVVGIVGRNGAGKTTLLKILSRITDPTEGRLTLEGRVGSLLEVGTGFHPELTGRENTFLNGAILGMRRTEIARKFDAIVEFAEIGKFLDTPVKRYSSGMYVRLAFAVAAHLEPEILVVDEVLAVGDVAFQQKCLGKMEDVADQGRTVLFVSHNMAAVSNLCPRSILLEQGRVVQDGPTDDVVRRYLAAAIEGETTTLHDRVDRRGDGSFRAETLTVGGAGGTGPVRTGEAGSIVVSYSSPGTTPLRNVALSVSIDTIYGQRVTTLSSAMAGARLAVLPPSGTVRCVVPQIPFVPGRYALTLFVTVNGVVADWIVKAAQVDVIGGDFFGTGQMLEPHDGLVALEQRWEAGAPAEA